MHLVLLCWQRRLRDRRGEGFDQGFVSVMPSATHFLFNRRLCEKSVQVFRDGVLFVRKAKAVKICIGCRGYRVAVLDPPFWPHWHSGCKKCLKNAPSGQGVDHARHTFDVDDAFDVVSQGH